MFLFENEIWRVQEQSRYFHLVVFNSIAKRPSPSPEGGGGGKKAERSKNRPSEKRKDRNFYAIKAKRSPMICHFKRKMDNFHILYVEI